MTTLRDAAQQALDALDSDNPDIQLRAAIALRAALAETDETEALRRENERLQNMLYELEADHFSAALLAEKQMRKRIKEIKEEPR
jgi:hypothetical protein